MAAAMFVAARPMWFCSVERRYRVHHIIGVTGSKSSKADHEQRERAPQSPSCDIGAGCWRRGLAFG